MSVDQRARCSDVGSRRSQGAPVRVSVQVHTCAVHASWGVCVRTHVHMTTLKTVLMGVTLTDLNFVSLPVVIMVVLLRSASCDTNAASLCAQFLPVYSPSEEEKRNPALYASNVRRVMAE